MKTYVLCRVDADSHNAEVLLIHPDKARHLLLLDEITQNKNADTLESNWTKCVFVLGAEAVVEYEKRLGYFKDTKYLRYTYQICSYDDNPKEEEEDEEEFKDAEENLKNKRRNAVAENKPKATNKLY